VNDRLRDRGGLCSFLTHLEVSTELHSGGGGEMGRQGDTGRDWGGHRVGHLRLVGMPLSSVWCVFFRFFSFAFIQNL
jgi:hypothetical protein